MAKRGRKPDPTLAPNLFVRFSFDDTRRLKKWIDKQRIKPSLSAVVRVALAEFLDKEGIK